MHRVVLTLLFALLIVSLNRDETWALPRLFDAHLTEADLEEIIQAYLDAQQNPVVRCNCDTPTFECEEFCSRPKGVWICGTPYFQASMRIRASDIAIKKAMEAGLHPWVIANRIAEHPYPFYREFVRVDPDASDRSEVSRDEMIGALSKIGPRE